MGVGPVLLSLLLGPVGPVDGFGLNLEGATEAAKPPARTTAPILGQCQEYMVARSRPPCDKQDAQGAADGRP